MGKNGILNFSYHVNKDIPSTCYRVLEEQRAWANGERPDIVRVEFIEEEGLQSFNALLQSKDNGSRDLEGVE